jgi:hypothetical protein
MLSAGAVARPTRRNEKKSKEKKKKEKKRKEKVRTTALMLTGCCASGDPGGEKESSDVRSLCVHISSSVGTSGRRREACVVGPVLQTHLSVHKSSGTCLSLLLHFLRGSECISLRQPASGSRSLRRSFVIEYRHPAMGCLDRLATVAAILVRQDSEPARKAHFALP